MEMRSLGLTSGTFTGVWCCASLLHLPKGQAPLAVVEMRRVLAPHGVLFPLCRRVRAKTGRKALTQE